METLKDKVPSVTPLNEKSPDVGDEVMIDSGLFVGQTGTIEWRGRSNFDPDYYRYRVRFSDTNYSIRFCPTNYSYVDQDQVTLINKSTKL